VTIRYSPAAREDLRELRQYLVGEFGASVAEKSVRKIVADISALKRHPHLLRPLADKIRRPTDFQYYCCGKYSIAIMLSDDRVISVIRILDGRTDYATAVFGPTTVAARDKMRHRRGRNESKPR